jgi:hypothetical protein
VEPTEVAADYEGGVGTGERVTRRGSKWWRFLRTSRRSNFFASRQRLEATPEVPLAKRRSCSTPKHPNIRRCAPELHASRRTKLELQRASASTRTRTHMHTRTHTHSRTHSRTHARVHTATPRALARTRTHARARARREQTERVRTSGPKCDDASRTEPGHPPGGLRVSPAAALSERNQQFRKRE